MFSNGGKRNDNKTALIGKQMTSKITRHGKIKQYRSDGKWTIVKKIDRKKRKGVASRHA